MKLRNKKTGIIGELHFEPDKEYHFTVVTEDPADMMIYKKLADLYAGWEDYEKQCWYIASTGEVIEGELDADWRDERRIGNYFETKEEANQAVEKLKAWKRLKDKGFRFEGIKEMHMGNSVSACRYGSRYLHFNKSEDDDWLKENWTDLQMIFGGNDE